MEKEENSHEQTSSLQLLSTLLRDNTVEKPKFESRSCRPSHIIVVGQKQETTRYVEPGKGSLFLATNSLREWKIAWEFFK